MNPYWNKMIELDADGIDFMPIWSGDKIPKVLKSYTRDEFKDVEVTPKTSYRYWKLVNGKKVYID